jgi:hypothetical protein
VPPLPDFVSGSSLNLTASNEMDTNKTSLNSTNTTAELNSTNTTAELNSTNTTAELNSTNTTAELNSTELECN